MKPQDIKDPRKKTGVSGLWLAVAAAAGAAIAYLGDPERGNARRQAAAQQLSGLSQTATKQTSRWRQLITTRLGGKPDQKPPQQVAIPQDERKAVLPPSGPTRPAPSAGSAGTDKPGIPPS